MESSSFFDNLSEEEKVRFSSNSFRYQVKPLKDFGQLGKERKKGDQLDQLERYLSERFPNLGIREKGQKLEETLYPCTDLVLLAISQFFTLM